MGNYVIADVIEKVESLDPFHIFFSIISSALKNPDASIKRNSIWFFTRCSDFSRPRLFYSLNFLEFQFLPNEEQQTGHAFATQLV